MEKHTYSTNTSTRKLVQLLMASLTALLLVLSIAAPGADAQTRDTKSNDTAQLAATSGCPDGFVDGKFGCVPENLTSRPGAVEFDNGCPQNWVPSSAPGGCSPGYLTVDAGTARFDNGCPQNWVPSSAPGGCSPGYLTVDVGTLKFDDGCPQNWVPSSAPGGCSPEFLTMKLVGLEFDNGCPDMWVPSSAPGGCSPGFITIDAGSRIYEAQFHCAFGPAVCDTMVEAIKALGGECGTTVFGETCTLPTGPQGRD